MARQTTDATMAKLSVIVASDYAAGEAKSWEDLRRALRAWAEQEGLPADEFILVESARFEGRIPNDVLGLVSNLKVLHVDAESSYELKNRAVEAASGDWVAIVDADCIPSRSWLRVLRAAIAEHPDAAAVSARTLYPGRSRLERILGLLSRSYLDPGRPGRTRFISGNAAAFRRDIYRRHPLPAGLGAFASRIQSEAFLREGARLWFEPELVVVHDFEGWPMERDLRRNHGYSTVITRVRDARLPYARLIRVGVPAIPLIVIGKTVDSIRDCFRCFRQYNVKLYELPLALALTVVTHVLEIPGMWQAFRRKSIQATQFR
ncbi:MAG: glycosyltransferase [Nitrospira sp. CG24D]|nr:MAG: glycosyltransferase [Nitrospira sp. CG24D]